MIDTIYGPMDELTLTKSVTRQESNGNTLIATEYHLISELVHRSVDITLSPQKLFVDQTTLG